MRKYYLFNIKNELKYLTDKDLYEIIDNMYHIEKINYEISLYNKICKLIDVDVISNYLENTYNYKKNNNKYLISNYLIELNKSNIVIETTINFPKIFNILNIYSKNFFVIDFENKDYFWIDEIINVENKVNI